MTKKREIKNCHNCMWLDFHTPESVESFDSEAWVCNKRELNKKLQAKMQTEKYQKKPKVCHEVEAVVPAAPDNTEISERWEQEY